MITEVTTLPNMFIVMVCMEVMEMIAFMVKQVTTISMVKLEMTS